MSKARVIVSALALSAVGFVGIIQHEGYTDDAIIPVPGDVPKQALLVPARSTILA